MCVYLCVLKRISADQTGSLRMKFLIAAPPTPNNFLVSFMKTLGVLWEVRVRVCAVLQPVGLLALRWLVTKNLLTKLKGKIP